MGAVGHEHVTVTSKNSPLRFLGFVQSKCENEVNCVFSGTKEALNIQVTHFTNTGFRFGFV